MCMWVYIVAPSCICREGFGSKRLHFPAVVAQLGYTIMCGPYILMGMCSALA